MKRFSIMIGYFTLVWSVIILLIFMGNNFILQRSISENIDNYNKIISDKLVRFHVIANSDTSEDQRVKLLIRDKILKDVGGPISKFNSSKETLTYLGEETKELEEIADKVLKENGESYKSRAMIGEFNFPIKTYGSITLPPGEYKALRVVLGKGAGKNWWCVMFPPLCFIDITRGLTSDTTDKSLEEVLNPKEINMITSSGKSKTNKAKIVFKFKTLEIIKKIINKL